MRTRRSCGTRLVSSPRRRCDNRRRRDRVSRRDAHWLRFDYAGEARLVEPYRLVDWNSCWYWRRGTCRAIGGPPSAWTASDLNPRRIGRSHRGRSPTAVWSGSCSAMSPRRAGRSRPHHGLRSCRRRHRAHQPGGRRRRGRRREHLGPDHRRRHVRDHRPLHRTLGRDFHVTEPAELVAHLRALGGRYARAVLQSPSSGH